MNDNGDPPLELKFPVVADTIPADNGYVIFSAVCTILPDLRVADAFVPGLAILPVTGRPIGRRRIALDPASNLVFRLPQSHVEKLLPLAGKTLPLPGSGSLVLGAPHLSALTPCSSLYSRLVTIKVRNLKESAPDYHDAFLAAARRMAAELGVTGDQLALVPRRQATSTEGKAGARLDSPWLRRTLSIQRRAIAGYALLARNLDPTASIALQAHGLGGRRHFGCGVFINHDRYLVQ